MCWEHIIVGSVTDVGDPFSRRAREFDDSLEKEVGF